MLAPPTRAAPARLPHPLNSLFALFLLSHLRLSAGERHSLCDGRDYSLYVNYTLRCFVFVVLSRVAPASVPSRLSFPLFCEVSV